MIPLHHACKKRYSDNLILTLFLAYHEGIQSKDNEGRIPFDCDPSFRNRKLVKDFNTFMQSNKNTISVFPGPMQHQSGSNIDHVLLEADNEAVPSVVQTENDLAQPRTSEDETKPTQMESSINSNTVVASVPKQQQSESHFAKDLSPADDEFVPPDAQIENESAQQSTSDIQTELTQIKSNFTELKSEIVELKSVVGAFEASVKSDMTEIKSMLRNYGVI